MSLRRRVVRVALAGADLTHGAARLLEQAIKQAVPVTAKNRRAVRRLLEAGYVTHTSSSITTEVRATERGKQAHALGRLIKAAPDKMLAATRRERRKRR